MAAGSGKTEGGRGRVGGGCGDVGVGNDFRVSFPDVCMCDELKVRN